jgi:sigma-B regulation protein RsbU (phosphoserine phosphatase)
VLSTVFNRKTDPTQQLFQWAVVAVAIVFLFVEMVSMIIGISMTRTITGAVHRLYEGTQKVMEGNFSHRIEVKGKDQLADLSESFNRMTENLERLLVVAKEKERLQSEVEIAREVQSQLYPRVVPQTRSLRLTAVCHPARMCSGDYYDYEVIRDSQVALAIGDVAGKGISAALLMATLQSSLRSQLQSALEIAATVGNGIGTSSLLPLLSTSHLVSRLNNQLYAYTAPEKYATFCFGIFDEPTDIFTYTNAGHLPPLLVRDGVAERLDVNGTVVGAFPFAKYDESRVELKSRDLLVCYTDGITEPENEYGEMFGEERLIELIARSSHLNDEQIVEVVLESVREWTATDELQDDMTILLARRV